MGRAGQKPLAGASQPCRGHGTCPAPLPSLQLEPSPVLPGCSVHPGPGADAAPFSSAQPGPGLGGFADPPVVAALQVHSRRAVTDPHTPRRERDLLGSCTSSDEASAPDSRQASLLAPFLMGLFHPRGGPTPPMGYSISVMLGQHFSHCAYSVRKGLGVFPPGGVIFSVMMCYKEGQVTFRRSFPTRSSQSQLSANKLSSPGVLTSSEGSSWIWR